MYVLHIEAFQINVWLPIMLSLLHMLNYPLKIVNVTIIIYFYCCPVLFSKFFKSVFTNMLTCFHVVRPSVTFFSLRVINGISSNLAYLFISTGPILIIKMYGLGAISM